MGKETWKIVDGNGNIECPVCGKLQSPNWGDYCVHCCAHDVVEIGTIIGDHGWDVLEFTCERCKKTFFTENEIAENYVLTRKRTR